MTIQDLRGKPASGIDWKARAEAAEKKAEQWRENFEALQRVIVGKTGASGITLAAQHKRDAERYRWLRDDPRGRSLSVSALEWSGDPSRADAVIDATMERTASSRSIVAPDT